MLRCDPGARAPSREASLRPGAWRRAWRHRARWLDIGCGTGILTEALFDLCDPASVTAIDASAAQIAAASCGRAAQRARFQEADAMDLPFPDRSFDNVVSALVIKFSIVLAAM